MDCYSLALVIQEVKGGLRFGISLFHTSLVIGSTGLAVEI